MMSDEKGLELQEELAIAVDRMYNHYGNKPFIQELVRLRMQVIRHYNLMWDEDENRFVEVDNND